MNFNDTKVRRRMVEHIGFAIASVNTAIPEIPSSPLHGDEAEVTRQMTNNLRNPIIMQVLSFTLQLDSFLKNSLVHYKENSLDDEPEGDYSLQELRDKREEK